MLEFYHPHLDAKVVPTEALFVLDNDQSRRNADRGHSFEGVICIEGKMLRPPPRNLDPGAGARAPWIVRAMAAARGAGSGGSLERP
jgi:hypothetical protein